MNIDRAIKIREDKMGLGEWYDDDDLDKANQLGLEALKWFKEWRAPQYPAPYIRLPGETEE